MRSMRHMRRMQCMRAMRRAADMLGVLALSLAAACAPGSPSPLSVTAAATGTPQATTPTHPPSSATPPPIGAPAVVDHVSLLALPGIGRSPDSVALLGDEAYVANSSTQNIAIIRGGRVTGFIPAGKGPTALTVDSAGKRLFVSNSGDKTVSLIEDDRVSLTRSIGAEVRALMFFEGRLFAGLDSEEGILVLDPSTLETQSRLTIPNVFTVISLAGDPVHHRVYANLFDQTAVVDSTHLAVERVLPTKGSYETLLAHPESDSILLGIYDAALNAESLVSIDPLLGSERGRVQIGGDPRGAVASSDGSRVYVADSYTNDVSVVDAGTMSVVARIAVDLAPSALALDEGARRLYVANTNSDNLSVIDIDTNRVVGVIPIGMIPTALVANADRGRVYIASGSTDSVFVVEGNKLVRQVAVGRHPVDLALDPRGGRLLVANEADRTVSSIDEATFEVRSTEPFTGAVTTIAVDAKHSRAIVNDAILDLGTLSPSGHLTLQTGTFYSTTVPDLVRVGPDGNTVYADADNGVPGSNERRITYTLDGDTLDQRGTLDYSGNTSFFEIDPANDQVYLAGTHPLALTHALLVYAADDHLISSMPLPARTTGMAYNPQTHHLFLSHAQSFVGSYGPPTGPADNTVQVLDTTSFGQVSQLSVESPGPMTRSGSLVYVADSSNGSLNLIQDVQMPAPPSPTPTTTPSPYPPLPPATATGPENPSEATTPSAAPVCAVRVDPEIESAWLAGGPARIGCPRGAAHQVAIAQQPFERGVMLWRQDDKRIYVLFGDHAWEYYEDTWTDSMPEDGCPDVTVASGLIKPKRGFGKVWCDQSRVRSRIGAATAVESSATVPDQEFDHGQILGGVPALEYVLFGDGHWE
ncbi:MAG: hypothetical protein M1570_03060 [Chloroflexi bacterium]|nr:hypothetical protein [Chloroflexota bacterium]